MNYYDELMSYVNSIPIIDAHEHISIYEGEREAGIDIIKEVFAFYYISTDLAISGMSPEKLEYVRDVSQPILDRWEVLEPFWKLNSHNGNARIIRIIAKDLYGISHIGKDTIEKLNDAYCSANKPGHLQEILRKKCNIEYCVIDRVDVDVDEADRTYYRGVYRPDPFIFLESKDQMKTDARKVGIELHNIDDWLRACKLSIEKALKKGAVGLKTVAAYERTLLFENASKQEATEYFEWFFYKDAKDNIANHKKKAFQDYMMHYVLELANEYGLVFQFHTGVLAGDGEGYILKNSDPTLMCNLFIKYTKVKFDLLHMGFPYEHTMTGLLKMFCNVYINMAWAHIISPIASMNALNEWLESVPANRIIAFGGDHEYIDHIYGHLNLTKKHICQVLAQKIENEIFDVEEAKWMAKRLLYDNAKELYKA